MKNKIFAFLLVLICGIFFACTPEQSDPNQGGIPESEKTAYKVVCPTDYKGTELSEIFYAVGGMSNVSASMGNEESAVGAHEIVLGRTNRDISETAYEILARVERENENYIGFIIYSDGSSVALAYEEDKYGTGASLELMVDSFFENYITDKTEFYPGEEGVIDVRLVDYVEYQRAKDVEERESSYVAIRNSVIKYTGDAALADDIVDAFRKYYSLTTSDMTSWLANLYEPDIDAETREEGYPQRGGFYYSNSGRNTVGFLPDLESTGQAMAIIHYSGMVDHLGGQTAMPEWFKEQLGNFAKSLQDPNGYFYHPQWGKALTDTNQERRIRDAGWAKSLLNMAGMKPTYNIHNYVGDGTLIDGTKVDSSGNVLVSAVHITQRLRTRDSALMVSAVVPTAQGYVDPELLTEDAFYAWLDGGCGYKIRQNSYGWGSFVCSRTEDYQARDKQLAAEGADWRCSDVLIKYLNDNQNPENGTWSWADPSTDERYYYNCVNGLLKIGGTYTSFGSPMPYALEACQTAIKAIYSDTKPIHICDVYNPWFAVGNIFTNITTCNADKEAGIASRDEIRRTLLNDAPTSILKTMEKRALFLKKDGSFSYLPDMTSCTSTGMTVALNNTNEGDVNATLIAAVDIRDRMCGVLGLPQVDILGKGDYCEFMNILEELEPVIKDEDTSVLEAVTFDDYELGDCPSDDDIDTSRLASGGECMIVTDPRPKVSGYVFRYESKAGKGEQLRFPTGSATMGADCSVFEAEMCFESAKAGYGVQLIMDYEYMIGLRFDDERVHFFDSSSQDANRVDNDFGVSVALGEWFKLRIEYYPGDHDTVRIKVYLNDALIAVSDNYYDYYGKKITNGEGAPSKSYTYFDILGMSASEFVCYIDNVKAGKTRNEYEITVSKTKLNVDVDAPLDDEKIYDFEELENGKYYPDGFTVIEGSDTVEIAESEENKSLYLKGNKVADSYFKLDVPAARLTENVNMIVMEADFSFASADVGATVAFGFRQRGTGFLEYAITGYALKVEKIDGENYVVMRECPSDTPGARVSGIQIPIDQEFKLRIEYYTEQKAALIYVDGALLGLSSTVNSTSNRYTVGELVIMNKSAAGFELYVDNLRFDRCEGSFDEATKPTEDRVTHGFNSADGITLSGSASVSGGYASVGGDDGAIKIPLNKRSVSTTTTVLDALIKAGKDGGLGRIDFVDENGNSVMAYQLEVKGDTVYMYEVTETKVYSEPIVTFRANTYARLLVEYYVAKDIVQISIDGAPVAESSIQYNDAAASREITDVVISAQGAEITLDYVIIEAYNKFFENITLDAENAEDEAKILTFEQSSTGNIPARITASLNSGGASVKIDEFVGYTERDKAIVLNTNSGGADTLNIKASTSYSASNCFVFEADVCLNAGVYMYFKAGARTVYRINLNPDSTTGKLRIDDNPGAPPYGTMKNPESAIKLGKWGRVRFEFYNKDDGTIAVTVAVNGYFLVEGNEPSWTGNVSAITQVDMTTSTGGVGYIALDNIYFGPGSRSIDPDLEPPVDNTPRRETFEDYEIGDKCPDAAYNDGKSVFGVATENGNKYYSLNKSEKSEDYIYVIKSKAQPDGANSIILETKMRITDTDGNVGSVNIHYGRYNGLKKFTLSWDAGSDVIKMDDWRDGTSTSFSTDNIGAKLGEWFTLRIENYKNKAGETIARVYVNGNYIGESTNAGILGEASANHHLDNLVIKANNNIIGRVDFDDLYFGAEVQLPYDPRQIEDFEDGTHTLEIDGGNVRSPGSIITEDGNSFYRKPTNTSDYVYVSKSTYESDEADCTAFEVKLRVNHKGTSACSFKLYFGNWKGLDKFTFQSATDGTLSVYDSRDGVSSTLSASIGAKVGEWFTLRIEVYEKANGESVARLYVNGNLIGESTNIGVLGESDANDNLDKVALLLNNNIRGTGADGDVYGSVDIDDLYLGQDTMLPLETNKAIEDFEDEETGETTLSSSPSISTSIDSGTATATVIEADGNKYFEINKTNKGTAALYVNKTLYTGDYNCYVFEADIKLNITSTDIQNNIYIFAKTGGQVHRLWLYNNEEKPDEFFLLDYWAEKNVSTTLKAYPGITFADELKLRIEYYNDSEGKLIARVYVDGTMVGESTPDITASYEDLTRNDIWLQGNTVGTFGIDNAYSGFDMMIETDFTNDFEDSTVKSSGGAVSNSDVTVTLNSTGASAEIAEAEGNKYLVVNTNNDNGDTVTAVAAAGETNADCFAFETDLNLSYEKNRGNSLYLIFYNKSGSTLYRININTDAITGLIRVDDNPGNGTSYGTIGNKPISPEIGDWFKLRIELYNESESGNLQAKVYINGKFAYEATESAWASGSYESVAKVALTTNTYSIGAVMYDDMLLAPGKQLAIAEDTEEAKAEILGTKTGADGIVVIMHDDGNTPASAQLIDTLFEKYGLKGDVALIANRLYTDYDITGTPDMTVVNAWQALFDTGRWNLTNHSLSHTFWGSYDDSSITVDPDRLTEEIVTSQEILRNLFPDRRVLTYAIPGMSAVTAHHSKYSVYSEALELLKEHYIGVRDYEGTATAPEYIVWNLVPAEVIGISWTPGTVDEAAAGNIAVIFCHKVPEETSYENMETILSKVAGYVDEGKVWNAFFEEAVMYLSEREAAELSITESSSRITVKLTDSLDDEIYNMPLTVRVTVPTDWAEVRVTEGDAVSYATAKELDGKWVVDVPVIPDGDNAVITPTVYVDDGIVESEYGITLANGQKLDKNYFPGHVRKSVTFTIDDGDITNDKKFISIVKPAGIAGTFNLINTKATTAADYLSLYDGYEIASHHQLHCLPWMDNVDFSKIEIKDEVFNSSTADPAYMYKDATHEGLYYIDYHYIDAGVASPSWHAIAVNDTYTEYIDITKANIEGIFGEGSVVGFAYPHGQLNQAVKQYLIDAGYLYARRTGLLGNSTNFALPADRFAWVYNANVSNLNTCMAEFEALEDDGELKFFSFGVHAVDFSGKWDVLESFAAEYGNRPRDFWYATNREVFEYEDALAKLEIYDDRLVNPTNLDLFVTIDNVKTVIYANSTYVLSEQ